MTCRWLWIIYTLTMLTAACSANAPLQNNLANAALRSGDVQGSIAQYHAALLADPHNASIYFNLALAYESQGEPAKAIAAYEQAILRGTSPEQAAAHYNLGNLYLRNQQIELAIEAYQNALRADPAAEDARYNLEIALKLRGEPTPTPIEMQTNPEMSNADESSPPTPIPGAGLPPTPSPTPEVPSQGTPEVGGQSPDMVSDSRVPPNPLLQGQLDVEAARRLITDAQYQQDNIGLPRPIVPIATPGSLRDW